MSTARHHAEWLSLVEVSGPFLSLPVLLRVFPQGLDAHDPDHARNLRLAHEEWEDNQGGLRPDPAIHRAWVRFILTQTLGFPEEVLAEGQALPPGLEARLEMHGETLRPDLAILVPEGLPDAGKARLLVQVYPAKQGLERVADGRHWKASPATRMMELLHATGVPLGLVTSGEHWMVVWAPRGEATGFASWYSALWLEEPLTLRAFRSLFGVHRFFGVTEDDTPEALFRVSSQDQQEVTDQLGYQVRRAVELLVQAIDRIDKDQGRELLRGTEEKRLYEGALTVMMRLVFLFSAEERDLLLLGDPVYDAHYAVSTLRAQLREGADQHGEEVLERRHDTWSRLLATFRAVYGGISHERLSLPPYGGTLFDPDRFPFLEGREPATSWQAVPARPLPVNNRTVLHLLEALQILQVKVPGGGPAEARRLSFRALDIEQIGHVYEGLLDHTAVRAGGPVLGLAGTRDHEPEVTLERLEALRTQGEAALLAFLREETGRSESALRNSLAGTSGAGRRGRKPAPGGDLFAVTSGGAAHPRLLAACDNDASLQERVLPFAGLLREDTQGYPVVITSGSVYVTQGSDRRSTGTHYTPRTLTEEIVQHTLDPLLYRGMDQGEPPLPERLRSAEEILALKVCDPAMGSGAFLVQAGRYLSERLVEAWDLRKADLTPAPSPPEGEVEPTPGEGNWLAKARVVRVAPAGAPSLPEPGERVLPDDAEERLALARRLVADHCLYGVDKNPMAVEMAKLSLWLITLAKGKPFTFLDHRLRHGDSLVGCMWREANGKLLPLPDHIPNAALRSRELREQNEKEWSSGQLATTGTSEETTHTLAFLKLNEFPDDPEGQQQKEQYYRGLCCDAAAQRRRLMANLWCAAWFWPTDPSLMTHTPTTALYRAVERGKEVPPETAAEMECLLERIPFFHWALEFPDACERGGFDAVVGNPPFQGGQKITGALGTDYRDYLVEALANSQRGSADLCAYFFLRAGFLIRDRGGFGMLATNTIAQGDTREVGLEKLTAQGYTITRALPSQPWPGTANLEVAVVWLTRGSWNGEPVLEGKTVGGITSLLTSAGTSSGMPHRLAANDGGSYIGSYVLGMGFVLQPSEAHRLITGDPRNGDVIFPYLNGVDLNSYPDQSASRWVINFRDWPLYRERQGSWLSASEREQKQWLRQGQVPCDYPGPVASDYADCLAIVRERVKPERDQNPRPQRRERWWQFAERQSALYAKITPLREVLVIAQTSRTQRPTLVRNGIVFDQKLVVFTMSDTAVHGVLTSSIHYSWVIQYGCTMRTDAVYTPSDCFETFPFPRCTVQLRELSGLYFRCRQDLMLARQEGLTKTYNRFNNRDESAEDIRRLRELQAAMDCAVVAAYGWTDLDLGHGFHETKQGVRYTLSEAARHEVLGRLLTLNKERYAEEVAQGLHDKGKPKSGGKRGQNGAEAGLTSVKRDLFDGQLSLGEAMQE